MRTYIIYLALMAIHLSCFAQTTTYPNGIPGCLARWSFCSNGAITSLPDASGNGHNGTVFNLISSTGFRSMTNTAMSFNGTSSRVVIPHNSVLNPQQLSIIAVVRHQGFYAGSCQGNNIIYKSHGYVGAGCWGMYVADAPYDNDCGQFSPNFEQLMFAEPTNSGTPYPSSHYINLNQWYFMAITYDGASVKYYTVPMDVNNHVSNVAPFLNRAFSQSLGTNTYDVMIGATQNPTHPYWFNGQMDEVALFDRALSQSEVQSVYDYLWQVITLGALPSAICAGGNFNLSYTVNATSYFLPGNTFTAQLSDASGSFATPVNIGTISATSSGTIPCVIPVSTPIGAGYRVRVSSSNAPHITDGEACQPLTITVTNGSAASLSIYPSPNDTVCNNEMVTFAAVATNLGTSPQLQWMKNSQPISGANGTTYQTSNIATGDIFTCEAVNTSSCPNPPTVISNNILMTATQPAPAHVNITANPGLTISPWQTVTFTATSLMAGSNPTYHWFKNGQPITGVTSNIWTVNNLWDNDTISVVLYSSDPCASPPTAASNDLIIHVKTGIADANKDGYLTIYPNPNMGDFYVETPIGSGNAEMTIVNSIGQVIFYKNRTVENGVLKERITLGNQIANGIYMLRIKTDNGVENIRFAIER